MKAIVQVLVLTGFIVGVYLFATWEPSVQAASGGNNNCTAIGQVGALTIARCVDEDTGRELYVNSAGFMVIVEY